MKSHKVIAIALIIFGINIYSHAQEGHYWSENYGNRSMLLSGTVNASVEDLGAVFYNPGRLGLIENPAFAISAKVYEWRTLKIQDAGAEDIDLSKSNFGGAPSLVAGTFKLPFLKDHKFAYSFITRQKIGADFFTRVEREGDIIQALPGSEVFNGKLDFDTKFKEEWIGLTWAPPTGEKVSIGLSTFISTMNKSTSISVDLNALNEFKMSGYSSISRQYSYETYGLLWKIGIAADLDRIRLGLTITTPRISAYGKGSTLFEEYLVGVDTTGDGNNDDYYVFNSQNNLKSRYKSPWAIGLGIGLPFEKGVIHLSGEWYSKISEYEIMQMNTFIGQSTGDSINFTLVDDLHSVINFGIGAEWYFNEKISAYASIATDYSAVPKNVGRFTDLDDVVNNSIFQADFYQFGGGVEFHAKAAEITVGATYRGATEKFESQYFFPDENMQGPDETIMSKLTITQWRFILGFSFPFADKLVKNLEGEEGK